MKEIRVWTGLAILALSFLALCVNGCTPPHTEGLPPVPASVSSRMGPVPVIWVDSLLDPVSGDALYGAFDVVQRRIYLNASLKPHRIVSWAVTYHEICHLRMADSGLRTLMPMVVQQAVCDLFATEQVSMLMGRAP